MSKKFESAFPVPADNFSGGEIFFSDPGMSLRDYFAAKAMQSYIQKLSVTEPNDRIAAWSYETADAMLKARGNSMESFEEIIHGAIDRSILAKAPEWCQECPNLDVGINLYRNYEDSGRDYERLPYCTETGDLCVDDPKDCPILVESLKQLPPTPCRECNVIAWFSYDKPYCPVKCCIYASLCETWNEMLELQEEKSG